MTLPAYGLGAGEVLSVVGVAPSARVKANAESTDGVLSAWESTLPAGFASPLHVHHDAAEFFYILEGDVSFYVNEQWFEAEPGAFVVAPRGARHGFRVRSPQTRMLAMFSPAAMLGMWEEIAAHGRPADRDAYVALARRYSMEEFGPLPEA